MNTQREAILAHLISGLTITQAQAYELYGCFRLSERIREIKKMGYGVSSTMIELPNGKRVAEYRLTSRPGELFL